jgi:hypothetical protein
MNKKTEGAPSEEDALISKKPLGGYSCASCEKNLVNMSGSKAEYNSWGKLPFRDPSDRLTRIGQGFSKMLSKQKPETTMSKRLKIQSNHLSTAEGFHEIIKEEGGGLLDNETQARMLKTLSPRFQPNRDMSNLPEVKK